jgi:acetoacetyl-CoA synthetase
MPNARTRLVRESNLTALWTPAEDSRKRSRLGRFLTRVEKHHGVSFDDHEEAWRWSVDHLEEFWAEVADEFGVRFRDRPSRVLGDHHMPGAAWFPDATLNYADQALCLPSADAEKVVVWSLSQSRGMIAMSAGQLRSEVSRCQSALLKLGVKKGDRVAAYLPNIAETLVAMLATVSIGAIWSSCAPEFGTRAVLDRFRQIEPSILFVVDGYTYGDRIIDRISSIPELIAGLPTVKRTILVSLVGDDPCYVPGTESWSEFLNSTQHSELAFEFVPFDHPLYILFSSGTTGLPKPIVHSHGGIVVEHMKLLGLYLDLTPDDRFFWFSTTGWTMWNILVSGLLVGSPIVLWDGDPVSGGLDQLWRMAGDMGVTVFGTSASFIMACRKEGLQPKSVTDLSALKIVGSTGAPLPAEGFEWVYEAVGSDLLLSSISGGTDVCSAFVGGSPLTEVRAGQISCRYLGCAVSSFDLQGQELIDEEGELVVTKPMPSMPVGFWGDQDGGKYSASYFEQYVGVWTHGDWTTIHPDGSCEISGRSDSTLNRGGVRLGTSDFYSVIEDFPEIEDSLIVHVADHTSLGTLILFLVVARHTEFDQALADQIVTRLRREISPRHIPDRIEVVPAIPRTWSGKRLEVPVKLILEGKSADEVLSRQALMDPGAVTYFEELAKGWASAMAVSVSDKRERVS